MPFGVNKLTGRPGPAPKPARDGDRAQARQRINVEVRTGRRPHPNTLPCVDCGHVYQAGVKTRRHEYDHHKGYGTAHHLDVVPVCTTCHARRDSERKRRTHCSKGHEYTPENTVTKKNGTRWCLTCRREADRRRHRGSEYWRRVNEKRRASRG